MTEDDDDIEAPATVSGTEDEGAVKAAPVPRRLTSAEWEEIIAHYEYGTLAPNEIWAKYEVSAAGISKKFKRLAEKGRLIVKNSKAHLRAAKIAATPVPVSEEDKPSSFETKRKGRIEQTKELLYQQSAVHQKILMTLQRRMDEGFAAGTARPADWDGDMKTLKRLADNIALMVETRWKILSVEQSIDEEALPKLVIEDLTDEEIERMQARSGDEDDDEDEDEVGDFGGDAAT